MQKKTASFLEKWGHYLLALLCAGVILASTVWAGKMEKSQPGDAPAAADQAQRLADVTEAPQSLRLVRPVRGKIIRPFSNEMTYDSDFHLWIYHPFVDFETEKGEAVYAMHSGRAEIRGEELLIWGTETDYAVYRGLSEILVGDGGQVTAGEKIGRSGGLIPMEQGEGRLCVGYFLQGEAVDFLPMTAE